MPTTGQAGLPSYEVSTWIAFFAPAGVPNSIVDKLNAALSKALDDDTVRERLLALGGDIPEPDQRTPQSLAELVKNDIARWTAVGKTAGMMPR